MAVTQSVGVSVSVLMRLLALPQRPIVCIVGVRGFGCEACWVQSM